MLDRSKLRHAVLLLRQLFVGALLVGAGAAPAARADSLPGTVSPLIAIENVTVIPMTGTGVVENATVVVRDGRIESVGAAGATKVPADAKRIKGKGKWLMPALVDMHVHVENERVMRLMLRKPDLPVGSIDVRDILALYVANGVLQILNMGAMSEAVAQREDVEAGRLLGPHMALAAMVDGSPPLWPPGFTRVATTASDGRQSVRDIKAEGYDFVKVYGALDMETYAAIVDEARKQKLRTLGHFPMKGRGNLAAIFVPGYDMVAHAEEFGHAAQTMSDDEIAGFVQLAKGNGTGLITTLSLDERILEQTRGGLASLKARPEVRYVHPVASVLWFEMNRYASRNSPERIAQLERLVGFNRRLVKAFVAAGIPVVAGTDALVPGVVPGFSLHDELEAMSAAGLTNEQVLTAATRLPLEWLGVAAQRGTVEPGKRADLLLLDADPLAKVGNTRKIAAVFSGSRVLMRRDLDQVLKDVETHYASTPRPTLPAAPPAQPSAPSSSKAQ